MYYLQNKFYYPMKLTIIRYLDVYIMDSSINNKNKVNNLS